MDWFRFSLMFAAILAALVMAAVVVGDHYFAELPARDEDEGDGP